MSLSSVPFILKLSDRKRTMVTVLGHDEEWLILCIKWWEILWISALG